MKLNQEKRNVETSGDMAVNAFTIKATAKAFGILSSGLYANKIRAIVRELSCNAWDSHVAAKCPTKPIEIHLPTALDPTFYVKDFGTGLDDDGVMHLYTTYFESTKADSNDFIGALGLGSKSPFSYTQSFQVEARHDGMKRTYTAFINDQGTPAISRMAQEKTDEPNGLTVSMQVKRDDVSKFENEAKIALMYMKPVPTFGGRKGFQPFQLTHSISGDGWKVRETDLHWMTGAYVVQGNVSYPIDIEAFRSVKLSAGARKVLELNVDLYVKIGDVDVAASREALQYTKSTIDNLAALLDKASHDMHATVQKEFDKCTSLWGARMKFKSFEDSNDDALSTLFEELQSTKPFTWGKKNLEADLTIDVKNINHTDFAVMYKSNGQKKLQTMEKYTPSEQSKHLNKQGNFNFKMKLRPHMPVLIDDMAKGSSDVVRQFLEERVNKSGGDRSERYALILRPTTKDEADDSKPEIVKILDDLGVPNVMLVSDLPFQAAKAKSYYKKKEKNVLNTWVGFATNGGYRKNQVRRTFSKLCFKAVQVDLSTGGYFLPCDKFSIMWQGQEMSYLDVVLNTAIELGIVKAADIVALPAMNEKEQKSAQKEGKWINILEHISNEYKKLNTNHALDNCVVLAALLDRFGRGMAANVIVPWRKLWRDQVEDSCFKNLLNRIVDFAGNKTDPKHVHAMIHLGLKSQEYIDKTVEDVNNEWAQVRSEYEMFGLISWSHLSPEHAKVVINYVNTVERARQKV